MQAVLGAKEIQRERFAEKNLVIFEYDGVMNIFDLNSHEVVESITPALSRFTSDSKVKEKKEKSEKKDKYMLRALRPHGDAPVNGLYLTSVQTSGVVSTGIPKRTEPINVDQKVFSNVKVNLFREAKDSEKSISHIEHQSIVNSVNIPTALINSHLKEKREGYIYEHSALSGSQEKDTLNVRYNMPQNDLLPTAIISNGTVLSKEKRIGVEYVVASMGIIVCVYNELITRVFKPNGIVEYVRREITSILGNTIISRTNPHQKTIESIHHKYNVNVYWLQKIDGLFYFSEIVLSEIQENKKGVLLRCITFTFYFTLSLFLFFLLVPIAVRLFGYKDCSISISRKRYHVFRKGLLFGKKPVYILMFDRKIEREAAVYNNLILLNSIGSTILHSEEDAHAYLVYPTNLLQLADVIKERCDAISIIHRIFIYIRELHNKQIGGITLNVRNVYISEHSIMLLGVEKMVCCGLKETQKVVEKEIKECARRDYLSLAELYYDVYSEVNREISKQPFSIGYSEVLLYNYRKYPRFIIDKNSKYKIELFDWISSLMDNSIIDSEIPHPVFWTGVQSFEFLSLFSDFVFDHASMQVLETSKIVLSLEVDMSNWDVYLDVSILEHLTRNGKYYYNTKVLRDLLRLIRNNGRHFQSIPAPGREYFNNELSTYISYFLNRYPYIVLLVYYVANEYKLLNEKIFREVFQQ